MSEQSPAEHLAELGLSADTLPRHIAFIMDGNGRWARRRDLPRAAGHEQGAAAVGPILEECGRLGIECVTLYSFSHENWRRPPEEVQALMTLYAKYLVIKRDELMENDVRLVQIGRRDELPDDVRRELEATMEITSQNRRMTICVAMNYGSRTEIVDAVRHIAERVARGELRPADIDEDTISGQLDTAGLPDPDLMIRSAGEMRLSNFLLWQLSYAELYVTPVLWPDFSPSELHEALRSYARRERRFGALGPANHAPPVAP
ncbi:MAG: isoprenyl transferase [Planctomycetota bacterium]